MNRFGQSKNDDLQKAIDEITNNSGGGNAGGDVAADLEAQIKGQMGVPPVPPMSGADVPPMTIPGSAPAAPESVPVTSAASAAPAETAPVTSDNGDLAKVRESALQELIPLMDKVDITAAEKFDIYSEVIESTHNKSIIEKAFEAARNIADEKVKAESLLKLVQMIDTL